MSVVLIFSSEPFQDSLYSSTETTANYILKKNRSDWVAPSKHHYLGEPKEVMWAQKSSQPERVDFASPDSAHEFRIIVPVDTEDGDVEHQEDISIAPAQDLGIIEDHDRRTPAHIDDILTYFEKSNITNLGNEKDTDFSIPNQNAQILLDTPARDEIDF